MTNTPTPKHPELAALLAAVRRRHHRLLAIRVAAIAFAAAAAVTTALALFGWTVHGEAVPAWLFAAVPLFAAIVALAAYGRGRISIDRAATLADAHFKLKDGLTSALHLQRNPTGADIDATELQWKWLDARIAECRPESIQWPFPRRTAIIGAGLAAIAIWLGLLPPSPAVLAAREDAVVARQQAESAKEYLADLLDELEKAMDEEGKSALEMDQFRKMVEAIDPTEDRTETARQFARIEQQMRETARNLDQRRDMETLRAAAAELAKSGETEPRQLGRKLENEELREAAEMLRQLAPKPRDAKALRDPETAAEEIAEARKELARMRAATRAMATAARQRQAGRQGGENSDAAVGDDANPETLEDLMAALDEAAAEMERALRRIELDPDAEPSDCAFGQCQASAGGMLDDMQGKLRRMNAKNQAASKLERMMQGLAQARGMCQSGGQPQGLAQAPGGREPGTGTDETRRTDDTEDEKAAGGLAQLRGQHGTGPSQSQIQDADSGTGVSGRRTEAREREFSRQTESFVQRDDIPETLKLGVRNYFENLESNAPRPEEE